MVNHNTPDEQNAGDTGAGDTVDQLLSDEFDPGVEFQNLSVFRRPVSEFEERVSKIGPDERLEISAEGTGNSGWEVSYDASRRCYQVHRREEGDSNLYAEPEYRRGTPITSGQYVPEGSRVWLEGSSVPVPFLLPVHVSTLVQNPFLALSAPVVNLNQAVSSLRETSGLSYDTRMSVGAISGRTLYGEFAGITDRGWQARVKNEDAYLVQNCSGIRTWDGSLQAGTYLVGMDGMGGYDGGRYFVDEFVRVMEYEASLGRSINQMGISALRHIEDEVKKSSENVLSNSLPESMGACFLGMTVVRNFARIEYRGDVRVLLIRNGICVAGTPTIDHNIPDSLVRQGQITEVDAFTHQFRNTVIDSLMVDDKQAIQLYSLRDKISRLQKALQHDPSQYSEHILQEISDFRSWMAEQQLFRKVLLHREPGLLQEWNFIDGLMNGVLSSRQLTSESLYQIGTFLQRVCVVEDSGVELSVAAETVDWFALADGDIALILSDGLTDILLNQEIMHEIAAMTDPESIVRHLRMLAADIVATEQYESSNTPLAEAYGAIPRTKDDNIFILAYRHDIPFDTLPG